MLVPYFTNTETQNKPTPEFKAHTGAFLTAAESLKRLLGDIQEEEMSSQFDVLQKKQTTVSTSTTLEPPKDGNYIIYIQNNANVLSLINNYRKQNKVQIVILIESDSFVTFIAKNSRKYPLILLRIPIDDKDCCAKEVLTCYEFPIDLVTTKSSASSGYSKSSIYSIMYKKVGKNVAFEFKVYTGDGDLDDSSSLANVKDYTLRYINCQITDTFKNINVQLTENPISIFMKMPILMLKQATDTSLNISRINRFKSMFEVKDDVMNFVNIIEVNRKSKVIATKQDSMIWSFTEPKIYQITDLESTLKAGFSKSLRHAKIYYFITMKDESTVFFIKVITDFQLRDIDPSASFGSIFDKSNQLIECYKCIDVTSGEPEDE